MAFKGMTPQDVNNALPMDPNNPWLNFDFSGQYTGKPMTNMMPIPYRNDVPNNQNPMQSYGPGFPSQNSSNQAPENQQQEQVPQNTVQKLQSMLGGRGVASVKSSEPDELQAKELESINMQKAGLAQMQYGINKMQNEGVETNIAPLLALSDSITGTQYLKGYKVPETKKERDEAIMKLQGELQKRKGDLSKEEIALLKAQKEKPFAEEYQRALISKLNAETGKLNREKTEEKDSEYWKKYNMQAGAENAAEIGGGKVSEAQRGIVGLNEVIQTLKNNPNLNKGMTAWMPGTVQSVTNPKLFAAQEQVKNEIQRNLRPVLGAQFTEKEGKQLMERAYDPRLSNEVNISRLNKIVAASQARLNNILEQHRWAQEYGSLRGYEAKPIQSFNELYNSLGGDMAEIKKGNNYQKSTSMDFDSMSDEQVRQLFNAKKNMKN